MSRMLIAAMATVAVCAVALAVSALARAGEPATQEPKPKAIDRTVITEHSAAFTYRDTTLVLNLRQGVSVTTVQVSGMMAAACQREALRWIAHGTAPGVSTAFAHCVNAGD